MQKFQHPAINSQSGFSRETPCASSWTWSAYPTPDPTAISQRKGF